MRGPARFLIRLYPANWRERYGEEFEALLEDSSPGWPAIFDLVKGAIKMQLSIPAFPKLALMLSITGLLAGLLISFAVTPRYVSSAAMAFVSAGSGVHRNLNEFLLQLQTEILSRTSLSNIIKDPRLNFYPEERINTPLEDVIERMRKEDILIGVDAAGQDYLSFRISFAYRDRVKAQQGVRALMTRFQDANLISLRMQSRVRRQSPADPIYRMEGRIAALEKRLGMPSADPEPDYPFSPVDGLNLDVLDPPSLPVQAIYPDRVRFMATGFGAGLAAAIVIAIFRRRLPPIPFPAQTA